MPNKEHKLRVFLCHASQDKPIIRELYQKLLAEGWIDPWLDEENLLPGQDWDMEIEKAVEATDAVIVCLSKDSISKEGYIQKEIKKVLDISDQKPDGTIFIIPLRLEECDPPRRLVKWHYVDYFPFRQQEAAYQRLLQSLKVRIEKLSTNSNQLDPPKRETIDRKVITHKNRYDHHTALVPEKLSQTSSSGVNFVIAKLHWGKDDIGYSLHVEPTSFSTAGIQTTDFLAYLGFKREPCSFVSQRQCYAAWVAADFDISGFSVKFGEAYNNFEKAAQLLVSCAHILDQPEGWGYFLGKDSSRKSYTTRLGYSTDGHTANKSEKLKQTEDKNFIFKLSWIESASEKGWVLHYQSKDKTNNHLLSTFRILGLKEFNECPYFDFEECYWMYIQYESSGDSHFDSNAGIVHSGFNSHEKNFSPALEMLVKSNDLVEPFGFHFINL